MAGSAIPEILSILREIRDSVANPVEGLGPAAAAQYVGISLAGWHDLNRRGMCPAPAEISERCPRWSRTELKAWLIAGSPGRLHWKVMRDQALRRAG